MKGEKTGRKYKQELKRELKLEVTLKLRRKMKMKTYRSPSNYKNQQIYFEKHCHVRPLQLQIMGTTMLFCSLEQNSDLVYGSLRHLNTLHKLHPDVRFNYDKSLFVDISFESWADNYLNDFLMTLYACTESSFSGVRQEALELFKYWIQDDMIASSVFERICYSWPWTNRNKYYFLAILFERHNFYDLLKRRSEIEPQYFIRGLMISLQYRNLISPGQTLVVQLAKLNIDELFIVIVDVLQNASEFELHNCVQWLHCILHLDRLYDMLDFANENILTDKKFNYLMTENMERLVLFRRVFKTYFEKHCKINEIDQLIVSNYKFVGLAHRAAIFEVLTTNTMNRVDNIEENLMHLQNFLKDNMNHEHSALRQDVMKLMPNLFYLLTSLIKSCSSDVKNKIRNFFKFLKFEIFDVGVKQDQYQPIIFSLRLYEILLKLLFGCRQDRLIKEFNVDKNERLKSFLIDEDVWDPCSMEHYNTLIYLVQSDFDDVREISTELLVRFYPLNSVEILYQSFMKSSDINKCRYSHLFARIALKNDESVLYLSLREFLNISLSDYDDPFHQAVTGHHVFGAVNCLNEFYRFDKSAIISKERKSNLIRNIEQDVNLAERITDLFLHLLRYGSDDDVANGSPSFEKMDESLELLLHKSCHPIKNIFDDKKFLLLSIWLTLKACCELASSIAVFILNNRSHRSSEINYASQDEIVKKCFNISSKVLLHCRHKGAIEASGLSIGKIVKSITLQNDSNSKMFEIVSSSVESIFNVIDKTDTTRRGAGFSIMILHLVKNDHHKDKVIVKHVMKILLQKYSSALQLPPEQTNRDNLHASILHFFCVLFKDGDLKSTLSGYMVKVFSIAISMIESNEWTIRNAALQLFGAIVPKLVGQSQYFSNPKISWEPVNTAYNDIIVKMFGIHKQIAHIIIGHSKFFDKASVLQVSVLELLSRVELVGQMEDRQMEEVQTLRSHFFTMISFDSEKIRNLSAKCLARFHGFHEIQSAIHRLLPLLYKTTNENYKHGIVISILYLLQKYESDVRCTGSAANANDLFENTRTLILKHFTDQSNSYYLRCYLIKLLLYIGFDIFDSFVLKVIFESKNVKCKDDVELHLEEMNSNCCYNQFGFDLWRARIRNVYFNCELNEEVEI